MTYLLVLSLYLYEPPTPQLYEATYYYEPGEELTWLI